MSSVCRVVVAVAVGVTLCGIAQAAPQAQSQPPAAQPPAQPTPPATPPQKPDEPPKFDGDRRRHRLEGRGEAASTRRRR